MSGIFNFVSNGALTFICAAATMVIAAKVAARWQKHPKKSVPKNWRRVGEISSIYIYPLKSGQCISLETAECTPFGLKTTDEHPLKIYDRGFIVYSEDTGSQKTARQHPKMLLIKVTSAEDYVTFEAPDMPVLKIEVPKKEDEKTKKLICKMHFEEPGEALDCGEEAARWMSMYIIRKESGLRLGYHPVGVLERRDFSKPPRAELKSYYKKMESYDSGIFTDLSCYMLMTEESVKDLEAHVGTRVARVSPRQFRPNFLMHGSEPFAEEKWDWIRIGEDVIMRNIKPCTRCVLTTIDPDTGIKDKNMEPLKTLRSYRQLKDAYTKKTGEVAAVMGINLGLRSTSGIVQVGDPVYVNS